MVTERTQFGHAIGDIPVTALLTGPFGNSARALLPGKLSAKFRG